jgi:hypothetical protein
MLDRAVRRPADGATAAAADGTVDQPGVEVLMPAEASQARPHLSRPARRSGRRGPPSYRQTVGRHGRPVQRTAPPPELLGWGLFATVLAGGAVWWLTGSWRSAVLVVGVALLALGTLTLAVVSGSSRPRRRPPP